MIFSLKNIDDAGFGLRNSSKLGNLLHRKWPDGHNEAELVVNVWGSCGHVFVATNNGRNLHAFETIPRSKWRPESEGLLLQDQESPIVSVLFSAENPSFVFIVHQNSITECWEFTQSNYKWIKRNEFQLSNTKAVEVLHVVLHPLVNSFFWCEQRSASASNLITCCVCLREVTFSERLGNNTIVSVGPLTVILHGCPTMSLHIVGRGVCLVPDMPEELTSVLLFWTFVQRVLKVYLWNYGFVGNMDKFDFKAIMAELLCPWISSMKDGLPHSTAITCHPSTNELVVLNSDSQISYFRLHDGDPVLKHLVKLHLGSSLEIDKVSAFFTFGLFAGLVSDVGIISICDITSGVQLCKLEDLWGQSVHIWRSFDLTNSVGFWSITGIWKLQSGTVLEVSECIRASLQTTNLNTGKENSLSLQGTSSKVCTRNCFAQKNDLCTCSASASENFVIPDLVIEHEATNDPSIANQGSVHSNEQSIFSGPLCAADHLMKWNINHRAAKLALDSVLCARLVSDCDSTDEEVPGVFLDLLVGEYAQSPAMALALLWEHPIHRQYVHHKLEQYVSEISDKSPTKKTCLNELLQPYIAEFLVLSKQCKSKTDSSLKEMTQSPSLPTNSIAQEITSLLERFNTGPLDLTSLERLSTLSYQQPQQVLSCISEYLKIDSEHDKPRDNHCEQRWRMIYRLDWRSGQWQRSRIALKDPFNTMLSILLRLFYESKPDWLMKLVEQGKETIQHEESSERAEEHVTQSVLECFPVLSTSDANTDSKRVHSQLCFTAGQETQALHLLLNNHMWKEAIDFVSCCGRESENRTLLFVMLIKGLQRQRAPSNTLVKALDLKPEGFSTHELLVIMRDQAPVAKEPFVKGAGQTTIGEIRPYLEALFSS